MNTRYDQHSKIKKTIWSIASIVLGASIAFLISFFVPVNGYHKIKNGSVENEAASIAAMRHTTISDPKAETIASAPTPAPPQFHYYAKDMKKKPTVSAEAYLVGDLSTGDIILEKNQDKVFPMASVSKLMTATLLQENLKGGASPAQNIQITKAALATEGKNGNFKLNEQIKAPNILYPLLMESSNDAAEAIAMHFGREIFVKKMNEKAAEIGMSSTAYNDPSGLSFHNVTSPSDLFKLATYTTNKNPELFKLTLNKSYKDLKHVWFSTNQFLNETGYMGGKSGYIDEAKQTVVSLFSIPLASAESRPIAITLLRSNDRHKDVENILSYLKKNIYFGQESDANSAWVTLKGQTVIGNQPQGTSIKEQEPEVKEPDFVTLNFGGDIMLDRGVRSSVNKNFNGDYSKLFDKLAMFKKADIVFANLEGPASDKGVDAHNLYSFRMDPSVIPALKGAGVDIVSVANNHVGDWGREAYTDTLSGLTENEISYAGGGLTRAQAVQPTIIEKYGMKIGYLAFSDVGPNNMAATIDQPGLLLANDPAFPQIIANASQKVDYLVVSMHFGEEYKTTHNNRQEYLAHTAIDNGAKLVIGAHPHVMQDTEVYKKGFIAYSLGNLIFDQSFSADVTKGMILDVKLFKDGSMATTKNIVQSNRVFQPDSVTLGQEEKVKFVEPKQITQ